MSVGAASTRLLTCGGTVHLSPKIQGAHPIAWYKAKPDKARPAKWTCADCRQVYYELCVLGGQWFIRRNEAYETLRDTRAEAEQLWALLVAGAAR